jgi:protein-disulfide isomerase
MSPRRTVHEPRLVPSVSARDHILGPEDAPVTLVEYGDYQCPYCGMAYPIVSAAREAMGSDLRFVFRNFPITTIHPYAEEAAEAAEAAGAQGQFWEMHDWLFEHQESLAPNDLVEAASVLALDVDRFVRDLAQHRFAARVREDFMSGVRSGVNGTPTFFINGARHDGEWDYESLLAALRQAAEVRA